MIKEILDKGGSVNLFTRPRRFGKTLALRMLKTYFELDMDLDGAVTDNRHYFDGKKIMTCTASAAEYATALQFAKAAGCYHRIEMCKKVCPDGRALREGAGTDRGTGLCSRSDRGRISKDIEVRNLFLPDITSMCAVILHRLSLNRVDYQ